ncbi:MAG: T9SS type A sorting domain-containing protein [Bacteroidota bacterium]|jgi:hypothetical protein
MKKIFSLSFVVLAGISNLFSQPTIGWYSINSGFQRGNSTNNNGVGLGSVIGQPFVGTLTLGTDTVESGFAANWDIRDIISAVGKFQESLPLAYSLSQNYPNPFNPSTTIRFELPRESAVQIKIYNILGQSVVSLLDEPKQPGKYEVVWNGTDYRGLQLGSGVYFCRIVASPVQGVDKHSFVQVRKMLLLK